MLLTISLLILIGGCATEKPVSVWLYGDRDVAGARLGARVTENNEIGIMSNYYPNEGNDSQIWGAYGVYHFDRVVQITNPFNQNELIDAYAYVGVQTSFDNNYSRQFSPFTGFTFNLNKEGVKEQGGLFIEYQNDAFDNKASMQENKVLLGMRFRF
jgi:hypothetical protein